MNKHQTYETKFMNVKSDLRDETIVEMGRDGWLLVAMRFGEGYHLSDSAWDLIFQRPKGGSL